MREIILFFRLGSHTTGKEKRGPKDAPFLIEHLKTEGHWIVRALKK
jgi:hypothetical protein